MLTHCSICALICVFLWRPVFYTILSSALCGYAAGWMRHRQFFGGPLYCLHHVTEGRMWSPALIPEIPLGMRAIVWEGYNFLLKSKMTSNYEIFSSGDGVPALDRILTKYKYKRSVIFYWKLNTGYFFLDFLVEDRTEIFCRDIMCWNKLSNYTS